MIYGANSGPLSGVADRIGVCRIVEAVRRVDATNTNNE